MNVFDLDTALFYQSSKIGECYIADYVIFMVEIETPVKADVVDPNWPQLSENFGLC